MKGFKKAMKVILIIIILICFFLLAIYINHNVQLNKESELLTPIGQIVEVNSNNMSVYSEGAGEKTLVFMSGGGTCSPILDFKSLYSLLSDEYRCVVIEKFGYGFSDITAKEKDLDSVLDNTRAALKAAGVEAPYVLCPHSMSGIEALYWSQKYPDEVSAIIGLDMAVPKYYETMDINIPMMRLSKWAADIGITRIIPNIAESEAIKHGTLTNREKDIYRAIFYSRTATESMITEATEIKNNARKVSEGAVPRIPILLFLSDGSGGTGFDMDTWRSIPKNYLTNVQNGRYIELDCPHYIHDYEYETISKDIKIFLGGI